MPRHYTILTLLYEALPQPAHIVMDLMSFHYLNKGYYLFTDRYKLIRNNVTYTYKKSKILYRLDSMPGDSMQIFGSHQVFLALV